MDNMFENIAPSISKFTSECVPVGEHGVIDLSNEREVIDAYKKLQEFLKDEISKTGATKFTPAQMEHAQRGRAKAKRELEELKPYINPAKLARLDAEFRNLGTSTQTLSEQRSNNMDKKIDEGFKDAIAEFMDLAGVYEDEAPCEDVDFDACFNIECEDKPEMSDEMGLELKDNDEEELDESIRDFLPKAGAFRNDDGKMIGGFIGNGSKDRIEKAKKIAKAKFYNGDRMGRVTDEEIDNFDEVYADLMHRAGRDPEMDETAQPKSYLKPLNETVTEDVDVENFSVEEPEENPVDVICMDVPLFMRCLEFSREDAQDDADLHHLVEKAVELSKDGKTLTMDNYDELAGGVSEGIVDEAKDPNVDAEWKVVRQNAKANPSLYGGRYADKDSKKARKEWEADRKENLKEGCSVKRKWKRIEKKTPIEEARHALPYKLVIKQFNQLCDVNRMARDGDELAMDFMKNRGKIYDSKAEARAALKQKYGKAKFANWIVIEEDTGF